MSKNTRPAQKLEKLLESFFKSDREAFMAIESLSNNTSPENSAASTRSRDVFFALFWLVNELFDSDPKKIEKWWREPGSLGSTRSPRQMIIDGEIDELLNTIFVKTSQTCSYYLPNREYYKNALHSRDASI